MSKTTEPEFPTEPVVVTPSPKSPLGGGNGSNVIASPGSTGSAAIDAAAALTIPRGGISARRIRLLPNASPDVTNNVLARGGAATVTASPASAATAIVAADVTPAVLVTGPVGVVATSTSAAAALSPPPAASPLAPLVATSMVASAAGAFEVPSPELLAFTNAVELTPKQRDRLVDVFISASSAERKVIAAMYKQAFRDPGFVQKLTVRIQTVYASVISNNSAAQPGASGVATAAPQAGARRTREDATTAEAAATAPLSVAIIPTPHQPNAATRLRELRQQLDVSMCRVPNAGPYRVAFRVVKSVPENDRAIALYSTQFVHPTATAMKDIVQMPRTASTRSRATRTGNFTWYIECEVDPALRAPAGAGSAPPSSAAAAAGLASPPPPLQTSVGDAAVAAQQPPPMFAAPIATTSATVGSGDGRGTSSLMTDAISMIGARDRSPLSAATVPAEDAASTSHAGPYGGSAPSHPFYPSATLAAAAPPPLPAAEMACLATVIVHPFNGGDIGSTCFIEVPLFATAAGYKKQGLARLLNAALQDHAVYLRAACIVVSADVGAVPFWTGKSMGGYGPLPTELRRRIEYTYETEGTPFDGAKLLCWVPPRNPGGTFCAQRTQATLDALHKFVLEGPARLPSP